MSAEPAGAAGALRPLPPIDVRPLLLPLHRELVSLLEGCAPADWERPTVAPNWRVRDVAAHLLDGELRRLSMHRDGHALPLPAEARADEAGLVAFLNAMNAEWLQATRRLSPRILLDLLREAGQAGAAFLAALEPEGKALLPVAWAGETASANWMDVGREYTERWHHQQQIRLALLAPLLLDAKWLRPVLEISLRALPHRYRDVPAEDGATLVVEISGPSGGRYSLVREAGAWRLFAAAVEKPAARIVVDQDAAWRIFFKAWPAGAPPALTAEGRPELSGRFLAAWAVMA
ncbi:MAG TPA: maleylpyruvate isomerase N-terminal domain-containing protein [Vicinamibacteria bacterium]